MTNEFEVLAQDDADWSVSNRNRPRKFFWMRRIFPQVVVIGLILFIPVIYHHRNQQNQPEMLKQTAENDVSNAITDKNVPSFYCFPVSGETSPTMVQLFNDLHCSHVVYGFSSVYRGNLVLSNTPSKEFLESVSKAKVKTIFGVRDLQSQQFLTYEGWHTRIARDIVRYAHNMSYDGIFFDPEHLHMASEVFKNFMKKLIVEIDAVADENRRLFVVLGLGARFAPMVNKHLANMSNSYDAIYLWMRDVPSVANFREGSYVDPLESTTEVHEKDTISYNAEILANAGIERQKIIIGLTAWGRKYHGHQMGHGKLGAYDGTLPFTEIRWINRHIFGGVGFENLEVDDNQGICGHGSYPLHRSAWLYMIKSVRPVEELKELKELEKFVIEVNSVNGSWRAKFDPENVLTYAKIQGGSIWSDTELKSLPHGLKHTLESIPSEFDARTIWPKCSTIGAVQNQGACNSCWAVASTSVMSDRFCIARGTVVTLCNASKPYLAFGYYESTGIVTTQCLPYPVPPCNFNKEKKQPNLPFCGNTLAKPDRCKHECLFPKQINWNTDKRLGRAVYRVEGPEEIQKEMIVNGPVMAGLDVSKEFALYERGLLPLPLEGEKKYAHAIKLIGWSQIQTNGETVKYWIGVNSFGSTWGEDGLVKIRWTAIRKIVLASLPVLT
ncbi:papain family cysteine protease domain-containing protein [Ditylenchus destructor]|uniref:Papain family cysteine protease domain-containing protein n=1 Tax=Ditylenchus destructor TaxID=166010 RepID=A0AAD4MMX7_9BILA|nr:papain family cysteine protease domain-containing protein [Ditylenchus destructor]